MTRGSIRCFLQCPSRGAARSSNTREDCTAIHADKQEVRIYDYVDAGVPTLMRMFNKRLRGYRAMGYQVADAACTVSNLSLDFQQSSRIARKQAVDELATQAQELELGY